MHLFRQLLHGISKAIRSKPEALDADQTEAAIQATIKMLNQIEKIQDNISETV